MANSREILKKLFLKEFRWNIIYYLLKVGGIAGALYIILIIIKKQRLAFQTTSSASSSGNTVKDGSIYNISITIGKVRAL